MTPPRSSADPPSPILYEDMFFKQKGQHPTATQQFYELAGALADYIVNEIGDRKDRRLTPQKIADYYRIVSGESRWDDFWLRTPPAALSDIFRTIGSFHSLEPTSNPYEPPSIPTLTREGFIRWILLQVLLSPTDNVKNLQYAARNFSLTNAATGQLFPRNLPACVFPSEPDPDVTEWHERCGERLKTRFEEEQRRVRESDRHGESPRYAERGYDTGRFPASPGASGPGVTSPTGSAKGRVHTRSTSASYGRERRMSSDTGRRHQRMRSFDKTQQTPERDRTPSSPITSDTGTPESSSKYTSTPGSYKSPHAGPRGRFDRDIRRESSPQSENSSPARTPTTRKRPAMLRHLSANVPVPRAPFSPAGSARGYPTDEMDERLASAGMPSPRSPRYLSERTRRRSDHIVRVSDSPLSPLSSGGISPGISSGNPKIRVSIDTSVPPSSRHASYTNSPASPRGRPIHHHESPIDKEEIYNSHYGKRRSGVAALGDSILNIFSGSSRSRESSRDREARHREREWRNSSRDRMPGVRSSRARGHDVDDDISEEEEEEDDDEDLPAGVSLRYVRRERERDRGREDHGYERERRIPSSRRYEDGPPSRVINAIKAEGNRRSKSHSDMDRPRARGNLYYN